MHARMTEQRALPKLWFRLSVMGGNIAQVGGLILGAALLYLAAVMTTLPLVRVGVMLLGWLVIYICSHALAHWAIGRLVGIRFRGYGIRGTDHPENYPPVIRQVMSMVPFFSALTQQASMQQASGRAKALMLSAGITSTTICSQLAAGYAWFSGIPGGRALFLTSLFWNVGATIFTTLIPRGDYARALQALQETSRE